MMTQTTGGHWRRTSLVAALLSDNPRLEPDLFKLTNWAPKGDEITDGTWSLTDLPFQGDFKPLEGRPIDRDMVKDRFKGQIDARAIVWALVWGYPLGKIGRSRATMKRALIHAADLATEVQSIKSMGPGRLNGRDIILRLNRAGKVNASTTSKIAFFAGLISKQGPCQIIDRQVIAAIFEGRYAECQSFERHLLDRPLSAFTCVGERIAVANDRRAECYSHYLRLISTNGQKAGKSAEEVETFLFATAPTRTRSSEIRREWESFGDTAVRKAPKRTVRPRKQ